MSMRRNSVRVKVIDVLGKPVVNKMVHLEVGKYFRSNRRLEGAKSHMSNYLARRGPSRMVVAYYSAVDGWGISSKSALKEMLILGVRNEGMAEELRVILEDKWKVLHPNYSPTPDSGQSNDGWW